MFTNNVSADIEKILQTQIFGMGGTDPVMGQVAAFEKLLRHAMSRFSKEKLHGMLQVVAAEIRATTRYPRAANTAAEAKKPSTAQEIKVKSVLQVRNAIKSIEKREQKEKLTDQEQKALRYYETFENDLSYLSDLKKHFDDKIHEVLLIDYFDPNDKVKKPPTSSSSRSNTGKGNEKTKHSKNENKSTGKTSSDDQYVINDKIRLSEVVKELQDIQTKWGNLLTEKELNIDDFDADSHYELMQFANISSIEPVLRLVPDVFVKCHRSIDIAREWWTLAQSIYKDRIPLKSKRPKKQEEKKDVETTVEAEDLKIDIPETFRNPAINDQQENEIKKNISDIGMYIKEHEIKLENLNEEVKVLEARESRIDSLTNEFEQMDTRIQDAKKEYNHFLLERQRTLDQINTTDNGNGKHDGLSVKRNSLDFELTKHQNKLKMLEYEKAMVQEDYLLELEIRPTFIHFTGDLKQKIEDLKEVIAEKESEKQRLEKELEKLHGNVGGNVKDNDSSDSKSISRQITRLTKEIADDLQNLEELESDRTFASESDVDLTQYLSVSKSRDSAHPQTKSVKVDSRSRLSRVNGRTSKSSSDSGGKGKHSVYANNSSRASKSTAKAVS